MKFQEISEAGFEKEVLRSELPVIVEFGASWCVPCKRVEPTLAELAEEEWQGVRLVKLDVDECVNITMQYGIMGVPTVILFVAGEPVEQLSGNLPRHRFMNKFSPHLE